MHDSVVSAPGREPAPVQMCMDILYTTSSAQSARELSLRRYSSVTVHRDSRCAMRDSWYLQHGETQYPVLCRAYVPVTVDCVRESGMRYTEAIQISGRATPSAEPRRAPLARPGPRAPGRPAGTLVT
jgi:hypothetical protein